MGHVWYKLIPSISWHHVKCILLLLNTRNSLDLKSLISLYFSEFGPLVISQIQLHIYILGI